MFNLICVYQNIYIYILLRYENNFDIQNTKIRMCFVAHRIIYDRNMCSFSNQYFKSKTYKNEYVHGDVQFSA